MGVSGAEAEAVQQVARDYFEAWYDADVDRMGGALHQDLVKRSSAVSEPGRLGITTRDRMLELTAAGEGKADGADRHLDIEVLDVYGNTASAVVSSASYHEHLHLVRGDDGRWRIANALWQPTGGVDPAQSSSASIPAATAAPSVSTGR